MAGRRPKPSAVKELAGNPGKRAPKAKEPVPKATSVPKPPSYLGQFGTRLWKAYAGQLVDLGLLTDVDVPAWECLCHAYDRMREAARDLKTARSRTYVKDGIVRLRPEVRIEAEARKEFRQYCAEFGLTPASRPRVAAGMADGKQPNLPMNLPEQTDPAKQMPEGPWNDDDYFGAPPSQTAH